MKQVKQYISRNDNSIIIEFTSEDSMDKYEYELEFNNFRLKQRINNIETMIVNHKDTLYFENSEFLHR